MAKAQLSGTYTIDTSKAASSSNYKSFAAAVSDLVNGTRSDGGTANGAGVSGAVVFKIADGVYSEQVTIDSIPGTSASNTVTFQSSSGDSSKVILTYPSASSSPSKDYTLCFNKASHVILQTLTVIREGSYSYGTAVMLMGNSSYITIKNCKIVSVDDKVAKYGLSWCIGSNNVRDSFNTFKNNLLKRGSVGIFLYVSYSSHPWHMYGTVIEGNIIDSSNNSISVQYRNGIKIKGNMVTNSNGIDLLYCDSDVEISKNSLYLLSGYTGGISLSSCYGSRSKRGIISNNVIVSQSVGIMNSSSDYYDFFYNNIYVASPGTGYGSTAYWNTDGKYSRLFDNVFATGGSGPILQLEYTDLSEHNLLYIKTYGGTFASVGFTKYSFYSDYTHATGMDKYSIIADPKFYSATDLHTKLNLLISAGVPLSVTDDHDGRKRSKTAPDLGAYEYPIKLDARLSFISKQPLAVCDTTLDVKVMLHNTGNAHLDSVKIALSRNGTVLNTKTYKVSLDHDQDSLIYIQTLVLRNREDTLLAKISSVNASSNDSISTDDTLSAIIMRPLSGNYIVGSSGADFRDVYTASNLLTRHGICGPVVFKIKDGTYSGAVRLGTIRGASANNRVTFQSLKGDSSTVIIKEDASKKYALDLDSASYVTFKKVTINLDHSSYSGSNNTTVVLENGSSYVVFANCQIYGDIKNTYASDLLTSISSTSNYNTIRNCHLQNNGTTINIYGANQHSKGNAIIQNDISGFSDGGVNASLQDSLTISGNIFHDGNVRSTSSASISCAESGTLYITGNQIYVMGSNQVYLESLVASQAHRGLIANNMISGYATSCNLYINNMQNYDIVYNSIQNTSIFAPFYVNDTLKPGNNKVMNNIFYSPGGGPAEVYTPAAVSSSFALRSNYNDLYIRSSATNLVLWNGTYYNTLSAYKTISGLDSNSTQLDPKFYSYSNLHTKLASLAGKAIPFPGITTDIDGEPRSSTKPYAGADESMPHLDAGLKNIATTLTNTCDPYVNVKVRLLDSGGSHIDSVKLTIKDDTTTVSSKYYKVSLNHLQDTLLNIGSVNLRWGNSLLHAILTSVNGITKDSLASDDTLSIGVKSNAPDVTAGKNRKSCSGQADTLGATAISGHSYSWSSKPSGFSSTSANPVVTPMNTTTYYLTETITATGCSNTDSVKITIDSISAGIGKYKQSVCNGHTLIIGAKGVAGHTYKWTSKPSGYSSTYDVTTVSPAVNTTYYRTEVVSSSGCSRTDSIYVTVNPVPKPNIGVGSSFVCQGDTVSLKVVSVKGHSYRWYSFSPVKGGTLIDTASKIILHPPVGRSIYYIAETDTATGCTGLDTTDVYVSPKPTVNAGNDTAICQGATLILGKKNANGYTYSWRSKPSGFTSSAASPAVTPTVNTTYYLQVDSSTTCVMYDTVVVNVLAPPTPAAGKDGSICPSDSVTIGLSAVTGITYSWTSNPSGFTSALANPVVKPAITTTYYLKETNSKGCSTLDTVVVTVNPGPAPKAGLSAGICVGDSVKLGPTAISGHSYAWKSQPAGFTSTASSVTVKPVVTTTYYLTESINATGCSKTDSVTITVYPKPQAGAGKDQSICEGTSTLIGTKTITGITYSWTSNPSGFTSTAANPTVKPAVTTAYYLTETNSNGCSTLDTVVVTVNPAPAPKAGVSTSICYGDTVNLGSIATSGHTYAWKSQPAGFTSALSSVTVKPGATTTYYLTESIDATGCSKTDSVTITVHPKLTADAGNDQSICKGSSTAIGSKAAAWLSYNWHSVPSGFGSIFANPSVRPLVTTKYFLTVTNDTTGCTATDTVTVTVNPLPLAIAGSSQAICIGDTVRLGTTAAAGNVYSWSSNPAGFSSSIANPLVKPAQTTIYYLTETTPSNCSRRDSVTITVNPAPIADAGSDVSICAGQSVSLGTPAVAGRSYHWRSVPSGFSAAKAQITVAPKITTTYYLAVSNDTTGCTATDSATVTINPAPSIASYGDNVITCVHASYTLSIPSATGYNYSWTSKKLGGTISTFGKSSINMRWDTAGVDTVWITAANSSGCKDSARFIVTIDNLPDANWAVSTSGIAYKFKANDSLQAHYSWKFGDGAVDSGYSVSHTYPKNTTYRVTLTVRNTGGCTASYDSLINVTVSGLEEQIGLSNGIKIYPNPFSNLTNISYHLDKASQVTIEVQDLEGRKVAELVNGLQPAGNQACQFNAGKFNCVPGVYLVKMIIADQVTIQRIIRVN